MLLNTLYLGLATLLSLFGFALLALSQRRHRWALAGAQAHLKYPVKYVRAAGWVSICLALIPCVLRDGGSFAAVLWPLILGACAFAIAMALTYRPRWFRPLSRLLLSTPGDRGDASPVLDETILEAGGLETDTNDSEKIRVD